MMIHRLKSIAAVSALLCLAFAAPGPVPAPFVGADIGAPGVAGSSTFDPVTGEWAISGGGGDIWNAADQFHYVSMPFTGNGIVTARVMTQQNTDGWAKAGVMFRETTAAGSTFAMAAISPGNGTIVQWRDTTNGGANWPGASQTGVVPIWVRMVRAGNLFTGYYSPDGTNWTANGNVTITMAASIQVGLAVTAHNNGVISACTFNNLTVTDPNGGLYWPLAPPTNLVATGGPNTVGLTWTASAGATSYTVLRSNTAGGPYTALPGGTTAGTSFNDNTATFPNTYYYVVTATQTGVGTSAYSNQATGTPLQPWVTATPNTGLQTNEGGATTTFLVTFNQAAPGAGSTVTVTSNNPAEGLISIPGSPIPAASKSYTVNPGFTGYETITVHGIDDSVFDGPVPYTITVTATNITGPAIPDVNVTNNDNDTPGITFSRTSGVGTDENLGTATFTVELNTQPNGFIDLPLTSSNTLEGTVSPASLRFTPTGNPTYNPATGVGDWNVPHVVTVTGVDDTVLDFTVGYTIVTGPLQTSNAADNPEYQFDPSDVACFNVDNEAVPALPSVWGGGGGGGGCGLTGLEAGLLLLGLAALRGRRRKT